MDWLGIHFFFTLEHRWASFFFSLKCFARHIHALGHVSSGSHSIIALLYTFPCPSQTLSGVPLTKEHNYPFPLVCALFLSDRTVRCGKYTFTLSVLHGLPLRHPLVMQEEETILSLVLFFYLSIYLFVYVEPACCPNRFVSGIFINSPHITPDRVAAVCWQDPLACKHQMHDVPIKSDTCFSSPGIDFPPACQHISWKKETGSAICKVLIAGTPNSLLKFYSLNFQSVLSLIFKWVKI